MENIFVEFLPPWVETGLQPAFYDKESGTVLQQTARMYSRVNMLIRMFNKLSKNTKDEIEKFEQDTNETINEYIEKFNDLHDYVEDYFDNLDVQEEINNKIDAMVEAGTLQRILNSPATTENIGGVIVGDGLQVDANGKIDVKAGTGITVDSDGVSETPYDDYIDDIKVYRFKYVYDNNNTSSYIDYAIIPSDYKPQIVMSDPSNPNTQKVASDFDYEHKPTLMINFGPWNVDTNTTYGPLIIDSDIKIQNNLTSGSTDWSQTIMGIESDGTIVSINGATDADQITSPNAIRSWRTLYKEGITSPELDDTHNPRTWIAQDYSGNYLVAVCGGRNHHDTGMTADDQIRFVTTSVSFNAKIIMNADGGGSSNLLYHGIRQNDLVSGEDRACPNWLVWTSPTAKHEAVFKNQSVNNAHNVYEFKRERRLSGGYQYNSEYIGTNFITSPAEVRSQSRMTFPTPFSVIYNIEFYMTGEANGTVPANTILMDNLPWTSGNYYVMGLNRSDNEMVQFLLKSETDPETGHRYSTLRNVQAVPTRKNYTFNQTFWTSYRQFDE